MQPRQATGLCQKCGLSLDKIQSSGQVQEEPEALEDTFKPTLLQKTCVPVEQFLLSLVLLRPWVLKQCVGLKQDLTEGVLKALDSPAIPLWDWRTSC